MSNQHPLKLVAVHLGAGDTRDESKSLDFAKTLCDDIMESCDKDIKNQDKCPECRVSLDEGCAAETAAIRLVKRMENNQDLNCGFGSNLNIDGKVECDAGFMCDRTGIWCGVGAVSGCKNPICLVKSLYDHQNILRPLGLVQPNFLVASGAKSWMRKHCSHLCVPDSQLISSGSFSQYQKYKSRYDSAVTNWPDPAASSLDTVGAIAVDSDYNFATAISSGGLLLKYRGRVGQAAVPGAGCWSRNNVAATTTGVGEYLTRTLFAKEFSDCIERMRLEEGKNNDLSSSGQEDKIADCVRHSFGSQLATAAKNSAGILAVNTLRPKGSATQDKHQDLYLSYGHNTSTMCVGYATSNGAHSIMSRQESVERDAVTGKPVIRTIKCSFD